MANRTKSLATRMGLTGPPGGARAESTANRPSVRERGQVLALFVAMIFVITSLVAVVIDVAWYWSNTLEIQRAADAAALAGAPRLPNDATGAFTLAYAEATKNGYTTGGGTVVTPLVDPTNSRRLKVTVRAPIGMFFMRLIGITSLNATRTATAEFVLPVPMGSPENYYGTFGYLRYPSYTTPGPDNVVTASTSFVVPSVSGNPTNWTNPNNAFTTSGSTFATRTGISATVTQNDQGWRGFANAVPTTGTVVVNGIQVRFNGRTSLASCRIQVELAKNVNAASPTWTTVGGTAGHFATMTTSNATYTLGGTSDKWGTTWTAAEVNSANFGVKLRIVNPGAPCTTSANTFIDYVQVSVNYTQTTPTTITVPAGQTTQTGPGGVPVNARGFWGRMGSQGMAKINGDAYLPKWNSSSPSTNSEYQPNLYYNYAIEVASGSSTISIFDPGFCATAVQYGAGDQWYSGTNAMSVFYELYRTNNTPYDYSDDTIVATSGNTFQNIRASDPILGGPAATGGIVDCRTDATLSAWHNQWWTFATVAAGTYRLHTVTTDPASPTAQDNTNGANSFSLYATGSTKVYGLGAMQMFTPLSANQVSKFYLAKIGAQYAGKTLEIKLWDPGDTSPLPAYLHIQQPSTGGDVDIPFLYEATPVASGAAACGSIAGTTSSLQTNVGSTTGRFNGCWVTLTITIPSTYTAPRSPTDPAGENGWWKILYDMQGSSGTSSENTTWEVTIRGKPLHLVP